MSKTYRPWNVDQAMLLPPSVQELVPAGHWAPFVRDLVRASLDLSAILDDYRGERGYPPYHPVMMTALLWYSYCQGVGPRTPGRRTVLVGAKQAKARGEDTGGAGGIGVQIRRADTQTDDLASDIAEQGIPVGGELAVSVVEQVAKRCS